MNIAVTLLQLLLRNHSKQYSCSERNDKVQVVRRWNSKEVDLSCHFHVTSCLCFSMARYGQLTTCHALKIFGHLRSMPVFMACDIQDFWDLVRCNCPKPETVEEYNLLAMAAVGCLPGRNDLGSHVPLVGLSGAAWCNSLIATVHAQESSMPLSNAAWGACMNKSGLTTLRRFSLGQHSATFPRVTIREYECCRLFFRSQRSMKLAHLEHRWTWRSE